MDGGLAPWTASLHFIPCPLPPPCSRVSGALGAASSSGSCDRCLRRSQAASNRGGVRGELGRGALESRTMFALIQPRVCAGDRIPIKKRMPKLHRVWPLGFGFGLCSKRFLVSRSGPGESKQKVARFWDFGTAWVLGPLGPSGEALSVSKQESWPIPRRQPEVPDNPVQRANESKLVLQQLHATISRTARKRGTRKASTVSALLQMPELFHILHLSMLSQLAEWMPPVLPKAQAKSFAEALYRFDMF